MNFELFLTPAGLRVSTSLQDYHSLILGSRPGAFRRWLYDHTQQWIHRILMRRFHLTLRLLLCPS